jgi:hypothetical protein
MIAVVIAEFSDPEALLRAARDAHAANRVLDSYSPFPVEGIENYILQPPTRVRLAMFVCGFAVAFLAYATEWWTATINYPIDSGGRPLHSWPAFMMFPFSVGILAAAVGGAIALFFETGLPRLHHPLFALPGFERASQDRFLLQLASPVDDDERQRLFESLRDAGALSVREVVA